MSTQDQVDILNDLLAKSYDAEKGFREAAEDVKSPHLKQMFLEYSHQRSNFGHELKNLITSLGGEIDKGDTLASKIHRTWMDFKSAIASNEEENILEEVKRGERNALAHYEEAVKDLDASSPAYNTVLNQLNQIRASIAKADALIPAYDNTSDTTRRTM